MHQLWLRNLGLSLIVAAIVCLPAAAKDDPVQWALKTQSAAVAPGGIAVFELDATIQPGWHLYSPTTPEGGPIITKIKLNDSPAITSFRIYRPAPIKKLDPNFNLETETYVDKAIFLIEAQTAKNATGTATIEAAVRYQACSDVKCLNPVKKTASADVRFDASASLGSFQVPPGYALVSAASTAAVGTSKPATQAGAISGSDQSLLPFLLTAFGFGLAALLTPCVFPMIPITVSFFLNQRQASPDQSSRNGWVQALVFCLGIIVLFTGLGFLVTAIAGPFGVVQLGSSPWVNGFIALVFLVFGLSLLGAFELRLPAGLLTKLDRASQGGGYAGTLLMGLTFSLTSFACIGPIVGPLLIASVQQKGWQPVLGMMSFATGLSAPFFLLALFPSYLTKLPRSGGWMMRVKVVLGFIVLAVMLKYVSNIDQVLQTHLLTRERFLACWIVLFAIPGLYLLGLVRMEGIRSDEQLGVGRALLASLLLIFSISLVPGLFGQRLGDLDAFVPEATGGGLLAQGEAAPTNIFKNQLDAALSTAKEQNKLLLINFTGYACTNCHWMKSNMFSRPEIQTALKNLIQVDLYTDGTDAESDRNQKLEDQKFQTASIPFYAIVDSNQNVVATFPQLTRNPQEFLSFLEKRPGEGAQTTAMLR